MAQQYDVAVIGAGPGGYSAAIRAAQNNLKTIIFEKQYMGGTCLNVGCIPSKALLGSAHFLTLARHANLMGLDIQGLSPNWKKMQARKDAIVTGFTKGVTGLVQANNIDLVEEKAIVTAPGKIKTDSGTEYQAKNIIIASGSVPVNIPAFPFDYKTIISSTEALSLPEIPSSMVIIGGGVIGCEMACIYASLGAKVTIVEALDNLLPNEDDWVGKTLIKEFKKIGIDSKVSQKVTSVDTNANGATVNLESGDKLPADIVLVAVGRKAAPDPETVENLGLELDHGKITIDNKMKTNVDGVYAIGDVVGTTYLAHGAFQEAEIAVANIAGHDETMEDYHMIPRAVYSFPEVASVGRSEKKCMEMGIDIEVGKAPFRSNGRSVAHNETTGEIRVIRRKDSQEVLGVSMVGATVTEMLAAARALLGTKEPIEKICFAHPTVSEVLKEAWEDAFGISIHVPPKKT